MTRRDRALLLSSIILALSVIGTAVILWINDYKHDVLENRNSIYVGGIIAVAVLSVFFVYMVKIRRGKFEEQLSKDFYESYQIAKDAVIQSQLPANIKKSIKEDVLDMMLSAQKAGRSPDTVIGDPEVFARDMIGSYASLKRLGLLNLFDSAIAFSLFVLGIQLIEWLENIHESFFIVDTNVMILVFVVLITVVVMPLTKRLTANRNPWTFFVPFGFGVAFVLGAELLRRFSYDSDTVRALLDGTVIMVPNVAVLILLIVMVPVLAALKNRVRKNIIRGLFHI